MARYVKDAKGQQWDIVVNVNTVKRVRDRSAGTINLFEPQLPEDRPVANLIYQDTLVWFDVLYSILLPQCTELSISEEQFGERFSGDDIIQSLFVFCEEWGNFLKDLQMHDKALVVEATTKAMTRAAERVKAEIANQNVVNRAVEKADGIMNDTFGSLQGKLDSILGPTRCGN